jgi:hypothetical protein
MASVERLGGRCLTAPRQGWKGAFFEWRVRLYLPL